MRGDQLIRQWAILNALRGGRRSRRALAERFGVSRKTITRDIEALSAFPISEAREGIDVFYALLPEARAPGLWLSDDEAVALIFAQRAVLDALSGTPYDGTLTSALSKVEAVSRGGARAALSRFPEIFEVDPPHARIIRRYEEETLTALVEAAAQGRRVEIDYFTSSRQARSTRQIDPLKLHQSSYGFRLIAHCHLRGALRYFNVNKIEAIRPTQARFDRAAYQAALEALLEISFDGMASGPVVDVRLRVAHPTAHWAKDRNYHPSQEVIPVEGGVEIRFRAAGLPAIAARVLAMGPDCEALAPPALRELVHARAAALAARHTSEEG